MQNSSHAKQLACKTRNVCRICQADIWLPFIVGCGIAYLHLGIQLADVKIPVLRRHLIQTKHRHETAEYSCVGMQSRVAEVVYLVL